MLRGVSGSPGAAVGRVVVWRSPDRPRRADRSAGECDDELARLRDAFTQARRQLVDLAGAASEPAARDILLAQAALLDDQGFVDVAEQAIRAQADAVDAVRTAGQQAHERLLGSARERIRSKAADVDDVVERVVEVLEPMGRAAAVELPEDAVIVGRDLRPSEASTIDRARVQALLLAEGGPTAHTAILARTYGIPAVVQLGDAVLALDDGVVVGVDGDAGTVTVAPTASEREAFRRRTHERRAARAAAERIDSVETIDGRVVRLAANIGSAEQARVAVEQGASEIGLFRTEFMFLARDTLPEEEEQVEEYRTAIELLGGGRVVFRTLDVGGDKPLPALRMPDEPNPMLGTRGIRLALQHRDLLLTQLRAMLRASAAGPIGVMFPMVSGREEVEAGLEALADARLGLAGEGVAVGEDVQVGIMVETPAAVLLAGELAADLNFLSIGTNDLLQYVVAAERDSPTVATLLDPYHPALWRAIKLVVDGAAGTGAWVGVCGESAGDPVLQLALVGAGVDELSMVPADLAASRKRLSARSYAGLRDVVADVLGQRDAAGVRTVLERAAREDRERAEATSEESEPGRGSSATAEREVEIAHTEGLHARPAHAFVERATEFASAISVTKDAVQVDAKSLLEILTLGAEAGDRVRLRAEGPDAGAAVEQLAAFLEGG